MTEERKLFILGLLRMTEMHGYMLNAHIGGISPVSLKKPTVYNLLERMERDGWIKHRGEATGDRQRKVYSVTESGEQAFFRLLRKQLKDFSMNEASNLVSLSFLDALPVKEALALLKEKRRSLLEYRKSFMSYDNEHSDDPHDGSMRYPIEYAMRTADLDLTFIDEIIVSLEGKDRETKGETT